MAESDDEDGGQTTALTQNVFASGIAGLPGASGPAGIGLQQSETGPTIPIEDMLQHGIEGYLLGDLESMATEIQPKEIGACGYPMVMAVLSGSELLGALTSDRKDGRINTYWTTYMSKIDDQFRHLGKIASRLLRNGVAHSYLSHPGVLVVRGQPQRHLTRSEGDDMIFDCLELYAQFRQSYERHARQAILLDNKQDAQRRLDKLVSDGVETWKGLIGQLPLDQFPQTCADGTQLATPAHILGPKDQS